MRIAVCEDEKAHQSIIISLLQEWAAVSGRDIDVVAFDDAESLLMVWDDVVFDVLILDIEMKKMSGMELAKTVRRMDEDVIIIFVTSHESYSLEGYDVNPLHYLTKPLQERKFFKTLDKAFSIYQLKGGGGLVIGTDAGFVKISSDKICYISMYSHTAEIYTADGRYVTRMTVNDMLRALPSHFINCHRSCVVNMFKVSCVFDDHLVMEDGAEIPVSRSNIKKVRELFMRLRTR
jgi:DNA-binding LytR/AlgR family response regulator